MIKAILFDFDGVLTTDKTGSQSVLNYLAMQTGISVAALKDAYYQFNRKLLCGETTHREIWPEFCRMLGKTIDYSLLTRAYRNTPLDHRMLSLVRELKQKYLIGMITDNKLDRIDEILDYYNIRALFDVVSVSAQQGCGKDCPKIFNSTLSSLCVCPNESVFIDNTPKNLTIPRKLGMNVIHFDDDNRDIDRFLGELNSILL